MQLEQADARRRLIGVDIARLATVRPGGGPHAVPICFGVIDDTLYSAIDEKPKSSSRLQRLANIEANRDASVLADHYDRDWTQLWWVRADGAARATVSERERQQAVVALRAKYDQYREHRLDGPILAVDVITWSGWAASGVRNDHGTAPDGTAAGGR